MTNAAPASLRPPGPPPQRLSHRLDREWWQLRRRPSLVAEARSWGLTPVGAPPIRDLDDLLAQAGYRRPPSPQADAILAGIAARASTSTLAARVTLQRIVPGLLAIARAEQQRDPRIDAFELLVAEAWCTIVRFPANGRIDHVAARLLNRARQRAFTDPRRRRHVDEALVPSFEDFERPDRPAPSAFEEVVTTLADARRAGLDDHQLAVLGAYLQCESVDALAAELRRTSRALRYQREHAVARVRRLLNLPDPAGMTPAPPRRRRAA